MGLTHPKFVFSILDVKIIGIIVEYVMVTP